VGRRLPANGALILRAGDRVTIVQQDRFVRTFRGPGVFEARMIDDPSNAVGMGRVVGTAGTRGGDDQAEEAFGPPGRFIVCPKDPRCPR
jgi:hypothetical protein